MNLKSIQKTIFYFIAFVIFLIIHACSQESNAPISKAWHNLNARDNGYFLARERTKLIEEDIYQKITNDYNRILYPLPIIDTNETVKLKDKTDDIIKKASIPINRHKNSMFVDNSYILIGKSRVFRGEWKLALETFKFVNTKGELDEKHEALIELMRLYILKNEFKNALLVKEYLAKSDLNNKNKLKYELTCAHIDRLQFQYDSCLKHMENVLTVFKGKREKKARVHFILGQLYQLNGIDSLAYAQYNKARKNNPPYELFFFSKLYMNQVASLKKTKGVKKTFKYYNKLLKDKKNIEYKDKIYYEMGLFEYKQKHIPEALAYFNTSLWEGMTNKYQSSTTYLKEAEIYYQDLKDFKKAKFYYDSAFTNWDPKDFRYSEIREKQKILTEFVKYYEIYNKEDSLLKISSYDSLKLRKHILSVIKKEKEEAEKQSLIAAARAEKLKSAKENLSNQNNNNIILDASQWYFYNAQAISRGKTDFQRKWGDRKLEHNWRRSSKEVEFNDDIDTSKNNITNIDSIQQNDVTQNTSNPNDSLSAYYKDIPFTDAQKESTHHKIKDALYNLGRIYNLKLKEKELAINTYESLLQRYPEYENAPQALYSLYLMAKDVPDEKNMESYKNRLITQYPNSVPAKILINPNYLEEVKEQNRIASQTYDKAFKLYEAKEFNASRQILNELILQYPEAPFIDKIAFLKVMIVGQTRSPRMFIDSLEQHIKNPLFAKSETVEKAKSLINATEKFIENEGKSLVGTTVKYNTNTSKPHFYIMIFDKKIDKSILFQKLENYHKKENLELNIDFLDINETKYGIVVTQFDGMYQSKSYGREIQVKGVLRNYNNNNTVNFWITDYNYQLFKGHKGIEVYLDFFKSNY